ncbi:MAG: response regulator [Myxococcales bacterium]
MGSGPHRGLVGAKTPLPDGLQTTPHNLQGLDLPSLRGNERRLRQVVDALEQGIWVLDLHGFTHATNPAFDRMLGAPANGLLARHALDLVAREGRPAAAQALTRCRQGERETFELPLLHADGRNVWTRIEASALNDERGPAWGFLLTVVDIGELKQGERERELVQARTLEAQKHDSLGILAGGIAHDFNNLLAVIIGQIEIVTADSRFDSRASNALASAISAAQRAAGLTRQLLDYAGRSQLQERAIMLDERARELLRNTRDSLPSNVRIELAVDAPLDLTLRGDPDRIQQSLSHLVTNAVESYNGNPGTVFIHVGRKHFAPGLVDDAHPPEPIKGGDYVFVEVRDQGFGMSPATLARVFEPFFTTKTSGRGLGLAACMGVAKSHGGFLTAQSELYRGSTFRMYLPFAQVRQETVMHMADASAERGKLPLKVLVVDDEPMIRTFARSMLEMEGYHVEDAASGAEALEILRSRLPEIGGVLLDLSMPGMDGSVVLSTLRTFAPDLPVVIQTGYSAEATAQRMAQWRVRGVLQKPYRANQLLESISSMFQ